MTRKILCLILLLGLIGIGCKKEHPQSQTPLVTPPPTPPVSTNPPTTAELRIFNATPWTFYNCTIDPTRTLSDNAGPNAFNYGVVDVDAKTSYNSFAQLYRYSWVRLTMNNKTYYLKPYDYFGETALGVGRYTYKLTYSSNNDRLNLELIKD